MLVCQMKLILSMDMVTTRYTACYYVDQIFLFSILAQSGQEVFRMQVSLEMQQYASQKMESG